MSTVVRNGALKIEVQQYADGRWGFDFKPALDAARKKIRLHNINDAVSKAKELLGAASAGRVDRLAIDEDEYAEFLKWKAAKRPSILVPEIVKQFLEEKKKKGVAASTLRDLKSALNSFATAFPGKLTDLDRQKVIHWIEGKRRAWWGEGKTIGPRRFNNTRNSIISLARYARSCGYLSAELSPVEQIPRKRTSVTVETYTPEEIIKLIAVTPKSWLPLVVLGAFCGLRTEEICPDPRSGNDKPGLTWENILWDKDKIDVKAATSKVRRRRFAALTKAARAFLLPYKDKTGRVVPKWDFHRFAKEWCKKAGVRWKPNGLRHSYASYRLAETQDISALSLEMGNSPGIIHTHYLDLKHDDEAKEWFKIRPATVKKFQKCQKEPIQYAHK